MEKKNEEERTLLFDEKSCFVYVDKMCSVKLSLTQFILTAHLPTWIFLL